METQTWRKGDIVGDGRFEILQELGAGGFGITYLAQDHVKKQRIAIKTLNSNQQREKDFAVRQKKFESEGFTLRGFRHPHIVRVYEKVEINGLLGFVMEYIPGQDLAKYVRAKGRLSEKESLLYIDQISLALDYVHQDTFLHRDVNPRNIMLREDRREAVLIDFGLAREFAELEPIYLSNTDGSELYKPVEQYEKRGVFGPPTDIYALAVTLYHLLNGAPLGSGKNWIAFTSIARKMNYGRDLGEEADRELWAELIKVGVSAKTLAAIQAGMGIEPEQRPKTMTEFRDLLGLVPATTIQLEPPPTKDLPEIPPLRFPETLGTSQPTQSLSEPPVVVAPIAANPPPGLTASFPTKGKPIDIEDLLKPLVQSVVTTVKKGNTSPGLTTSISPPAKPIEDIKKKVEPVRSTGVESNRSTLPQARPQPGFTIPDRDKQADSQRKKKNPSSSISRRFILQGLIGTGGLAGFGFIGLLLKNLFEPQSKPKPSAQANTVFALETIQFATVKLDNQGKVIARPKKTAQIYKEDLGSGISLTMVKIPAGSFLMGSPIGEKNSQANEKPQHKVNLKSFYLGQTEVTRSQYHAIMGTNSFSFEGAKLPVDGVSWLDAKEFCKKLSQKSGKSYSLPSESQWEYACRAGTTTPFAFGDTITTDMANYGVINHYEKPSKIIYRENITSVKTFPPNAFGVFDMHGNVFEWCEDIWHDNYQGAPIDGSSWGSKNDNDSHLLRGGAQNHPEFACRSANRDHYTRDNIDGNIRIRIIRIGFRVAFSAQDL